MDRNATFIQGFALLTAGMYPGQISPCNAFTRDGETAFDQICRWVANFDNPNNQSKPRLLAIAIPDPNATLNTHGVFLLGMRDVTAEFLQAVAGIYIAPNLPQPGV